MIKLLIFDLDNTLYAEGDYVISGFKTVAKYVQHKFNKSYFEAYRLLLESFIRNGRGKNIETLVQKFALGAGVVPELINVYRSHVPDIRMSEQVVELLGRLGVDHQLCLITNGWPNVQARKVEALGLENYFDLILYSQLDGLQYAKPHQKYFLEALERFNVDPSEALVIGDDWEADIKGAMNVSIEAVHIKNVMDNDDAYKILNKIKVWQS